MVRLTILLFVIVLASACSRTLTVDLASPNERIPEPTFIIKDYGKAGQVADYSQVKIFDKTEGCVVPNCPLVWHINVAAGSPAEIAYGAFPGFGSMTLVSPRQLKKNHSYIMVVDEYSDKPQKNKGALSFYVNEDGRVLPEK